MADTALQEYLDLLDSQRQAAFAALEGLDEEEIWQRPAPKEWCIGEILSHTVRFYDSFFPLFRFVWKVMAWYGRLHRKRPYRTEIDNVYERPGFPHWAGFLWSPRHTPAKPQGLAVLRAEVEAVHDAVRQFYAGKDLDVLGNVHAWDPAIGVVNLITGLKVCIDHDQLHYGDVIELAAALRASPERDP
jgi:hypothetical protein